MDVGDRLVAEDPGRPGGDTGWRDGSGAQVIEEGLQVVKVDIGNGRIVGQVGEKFAVGVVVIVDGVAGFSGGAQVAVVLFDGL